jgi:hypothetical protein
LFNEFFVDPCTTRLGRGPWTVNLFHRIFFRKIILEIPENPRLPYFYKKNPELF